jgi:hypothetical protein
MERCQLSLPWSVEEWTSCFVVKDSAGRALAHVHFAHEAAYREAAKLLARDDAKQIADSIVELPGLLRKHAEARPLLSAETQSSEVSTRSDIYANAERLL